MYKLFPILGFALFGSTTFSQVAKNYVTIESSTGTWCSACPAVATIFNNMEASGKKVALIKNHTNDSYATVDSGLRNSYYAVSYYPQAFIDGEGVPEASWSNASVFNTMYNTAIAELSPFQITLNVLESGNTVGVSGTVTKVSAVSSTNLSLHIVVTESNVGELNHINRKMVPSWFGTPLDFSSSTTYDFNESFTLDASWDANNLKIIVFVQDNSTKEIYQTNQGSIIDAAGTEEHTLIRTRIYPNPSIDQLTIESNAIQLIELMQLSGEMVLTQTGNSENKVSVNLSDLELQSGTYLLKVTQDDGFCTVKKIQIL